MKLSLARAPRRTLLSLVLAATAACSSGDSDPAPPPPPRTLARLDVSPAAPWLVVDSTMRFYAMAFYSDQTSADVTEQATWSSSAGTVVSVSTDPGTRGAAQALGVGSSTVTATYEGVSGSTDATVLEAGSGTTLVGTVTYDFVPATYSPATESGTLQFGASYQKPVRGAVVRVMQGATQLGETTTDEAGHYAITFVGTGTVQVIALAKTRSPPLQVEDNTHGDAVWAIGTSVAAVNATVNLHATHGWTGSSYDLATRAAAPFAILDSMYTAAKGFLAVRSPVFPSLRVNWSPDNLSTSDSYDPANGFIGTSHYSPSQGEIYILGKDGEDTDEFDSHVIVHEWAHYFEDNLSRSESPGGPHATGDVLDPRLAFGEGYASAIAGMLLGEAIYADTGWWDGVHLEAFGFDAETTPSPTDDCVLPPGAVSLDSCVAGLNPGPFSEMSIIRALHDLWDPGTNEAWDTTAIDLGTIYDVLVGPEKETQALTTIGSFIAGLKAQASVSTAAVDAVLDHYSIGSISDEWGTGDPDLRAMYSDVSVLPSGNSFTLDGRFAPNMRQQNRYLVFTATTTSATVTSSCPYDVDLYAYGSGQLMGSDDSLDGNERVQFATTPGAVYVIVLTGWGAVNGPYTATVSISTP
jgi:hypothetical protein